MGDDWPAAVQSAKDDAILNRHQAAVRRRAEHNMQRPNRRVRKPCRGRRKSQPNPEDRGCPHEYQRTSALAGPRSYRVIPQAHHKRYQEHLLPRPAAAFTGRPPEPAQRLHQAARSDA